MTYSVDDLKVIFARAQARAEAASQQVYEQYGTDHVGACGFAWVDIFKFEGKPIKGNTKIGRALKAAGIDQNWNRTFSQWCTWYAGQSVDIKEAGAQAYADVLRGYGFEAYAGSRLD